MEKQGFDRDDKMTRILSEQARSGDKVAQSVLKDLGVSWEAKDAEVSSTVSQPEAKPVETASVNMGGFEAALGDASSDSQVKAEVAVLQNEEAKVVVREEPLTAKEQELYEKYNSWYDPKTNKEHSAEEVQNYRRELIESRKFTQQSSEEPKKDTGPSVVGEVVDENEIPNLDDEETESKNEAGVEKKWYPGINEDLDVATMVVHHKKRGNDGKPVDRSDDEKRADRKKINDAIDRLESNGINVEPLRPRDGSDNGRRLIKEAKNIYFDNAQPLPNRWLDDKHIANKNEAEGVLRFMGFDLDKMVEDRQTKKEEASRVAAEAAAKKAAERPNPTPTPAPVPEAPTPAPASERTNKKENFADYLKDNEVILNKLLLQSWNPSLILNPERTRLAKMVEFSSSIHKNRLLEGFRNGNPNVYAEMFLVAQDLYLKEVLGEKDFFQLVGDSDGIKRQELNSGEKNIELRIRFEGKISGYVSKIFHGEKRRWFEYGADGDAMKTRLENFLINKYNKSEIIEDKSKIGVVVKFLKSVYLQSDEIRGTQEMKIAKEPEAELLRQVIKIHDLAVVMDAPTFKSVENIRAELLQSVDTALIEVLSLKKNGVSIIPSVVESYDTVMRNIYRTTGREINIDDELIKIQVASSLSGLGISSEELNLFLKMGRDICRLTGIDAQYGLPKEVTTGTKGLALTVKGAFLRGLLDYNKNLITYGTNQALTGGIKLGVTPFWNDIRKIDNVESLPLTARDIDSLIDTKMKGNSTFESWIGKLKGYSEAKKAEGEFMNSTIPTLENFITKVVPAYQGYLQFTPDKGKSYLLGRLTSCVPYFLEKGERRARLENSIIQQFLKDGNFDGKGIFDNTGELKKYFSKLKIYPNIRPGELKARDEAANEAGRRGDILGVIKSMFK